MNTLDYDSTPSGSPCSGSRLAYSVRDAAKATGLGRTTLYRLIADGQLRRIKIGNRTLIRCRDLEALFNVSLGGEG